MLSVACVLRSGPEYRADHVYKLRDAVARNLSIPHRFVCLSNQNLFDVETIALRHLWDGWWSKIELFRPELFDGPVLYADLDTDIVRPIDDIVLDHRFTVLENFWSKDRIGSGLMAWDCDLSSIYDQFCRAPHTFISRYVTKERWGDQGFIFDHSPIEPDRWQRRYPGRVVSFKMHCLKARRIPDAASIVCFHGKPRPWELTRQQRTWFEECRQVA